MRIDFLRFSNNAIFPTKGSPNAAGFDLYSTEEVIVSPSGIVPTDVGFNPIQDGGEQKGLPTSFYPVTSTNLGLSPQNSLTFSFSPFSTLV